uniref:Uncharacterized protein n=1 Tax=Cyanothece sp. (strain PCC 7425 / ATCC 29141) TaxID=395961 RepID=B8HYU0_CYAP4
MNHEFIQTTLPMLVRGVATIGSAVFILAYAREYVLRFELKAPPSPPSSEANRKLQQVEAQEQQLRARVEELQLALEQAKANQLTLNSELEQASAIQLTLNSELEQVQLELQTVQQTLVHYQDLSNNLEVQLSVKQADLDKAVMELARTQRGFRGVINAVFDLLEEAGATFLGLRGGEQAALPPTTASSQSEMPQI